MKGEKMKKEGRRRDRGDVEAKKRGVGKGEVTSGGRVAEKRSGTIQREREKK